jgi:drug/metabolite transporter (DMT)-like permease
MSRQQCVLVHFGLLITVLTLVSFASSYLLFSSDSGWQFGFGLILAFQEMILAGLTTAVYAMTLSNESLPTLRHILKLILSGVVVSLLIASLLAYFGLAMLGFTLFHLLMLVSPYFYILFDKVREQS